MAECMICKEKHTPLCMQICTIAHMPLSYIATRYEHLSLNASRIQVGGKCLLSTSSSEMKIERNSIFYYHICFFLTVIKYFFQIFAKSVFIHFQ